MTPTARAALHGSWAAARSLGPAAAALLYRRLFETAPHLRALFAGTNMEAQGRHLLAAIDGTVARLDDPGLPAMLAELGALHARAGVRAADFAPVGAALLWTLETGLGPDWTAEAKGAWAEAFALVAQAMQAGMRAAA